MAKAYISLFKRLKITRIVCMLLFVLSVNALTGCASDMVPDSDASDSARIEQSMKGCWTCSFFKSAFDTSRNMTKLVVPTVAKNAVPLVAVGYGLWLAIFLMKYLGSVKEPDVGAFWKGLTTQTFWLVMGVALLRALSTGTVGDAVTSFAEPVFRSFIDVGLTVVQSTGGDIPCSPGNSPDASLICLVKALQEKLNSSSGISLIAIYFGAAVGLGPFIMLIGVVMFAISTIMSIYFPLLLLDSVFRYGIAICMLPLAVASYTFKCTRQFAGKVAILFVEIGFYVMGMSAFSAICVQIMGAYIDRFLPFIRNPLFFITNLKALGQVLCGPGLTGLMFLAFFLILFGEVLGDFMKALSGGAGGMGSNVKGTRQGVKAIMKAPANVARVGVFFGNRARRRKARDTAKNYDALTKAFKDNPTAENAQKYHDAKDLLTRVGYLDEHGEKTDDFKKAVKERKTFISKAWNYTEGLHDDIESAKDLTKGYAEGAFGKSVEKEGTMTKA